MPLEGYSGPGAPSQLIGDATRFIFNPCAGRGDKKNEEGVDNRRKVRAGPGRLRLSLACAGRADHKVALACLAQVRLAPHLSHRSLRHSNGCTAPQNRRF